NVSDVRISSTNNKKACSCSMLQIKDLTLSCGLQDLNYDT
ncbi:1382_t:CDS:2, partial [Entrophospora sp. SA101]